MPRRTFALMLLMMVAGAFEALFRVVCRSDGWGPVR
jgi:hypothetical protein